MSIITHPRRTAILSATLVAGAALAGVVPAVTSASSIPAGAGDYCAAHLAAEAAFNAGDPEAIGPAVEGLFATAPEEIAATVQTMIDNAPTDGPPSPEFISSYNTVASYVRDNCGFAELQVLAQDYSFGGIPEQVPAGPTVIELVNEGTEMHEIILMRRGEGVDEPFEELILLPEEEVFSMLTPSGSAFSYPGESGFAVVDLVPGNYIGLCFIPVGTTPEAFEQMMAAMGSAPADSMAGHDMGTDPAGSAPAGSAPAGSAPAEGAPEGSEPPPHFVEGMIVEFTVGDGAVATTTA